MKIDFIKGEIRRKSIKNGSIIAVLIVLFIAANQYSSSINESFTSVENEVKSLKSQIAQKSKEFEQSKNEMEIYNKISKSKLPSKESYELGRERLQVLLPLIQEKKDVYIFKKINFSLGEIKPDTQIRNGIFEVYENSVQLDMEGATDEYVLSFLDNLQNQLPGYISIEKISIKRENDINGTTVNSYISDPKYFLVSSSLKLKWSTLKLIGKEQAPAKANEKAKQKNPAKK